MPPTDEEFGAGRPDGLTAQTALPISHHPATNAPQAAAAAWESVPSGKGGGL